MKTIYLYGEVGYDMTAEALKKDLPKNSIEKVRIILDSPGGSVSEGIRIHNLIKSYKGEVEIVLGAMVASSAAYIAMSVPKEKRKAFENSSMMIHEASSAIRGRARDFKTTYDRLQAVNNIMADSFAADMGRTREEALALMSEDYYMTGWEQLAEHNIISDIINPKDVEFPEPTQENFTWDFFFAQLENKAEENFVKEKMYQAEEKALEDWEKNNTDMGKMVALLKTDLTPVEKPVEENNKTEEKMNLQEFLKSNPEAEAEYNKALQSAEQKGIDSVQAKFANDRKRIANILELSGIKLPDSTIEAIENNIDEGEFAKQELMRQRELRAEKKESAFANIRIDSPQTPGAQAPAVIAQVDDFDEKLNKAFENKGGKK